MASVYEFITKNSTSTTANQEKGSGGGKVKKTSKSTESLFAGVFGGEKGGVEANRKTRAINPLLNRATNGWWEKGTRLGRAGMNLVQIDKKTGSLSISGVGLTIIASFIIQQILKAQREQKIEATKENQNNFKKLESGGDSAIGGQFSINTNYWDGKVSYNQNK